MGSLIPQLEATRNLNIFVDNIFLNVASCITRNIIVNNFPIAA